MNPLRRAFDIAFALLAGRSMRQLAVVGAPASAPTEVVAKPSAKGESPMTPEDRASVEKHRALMGRIYCDACGEPIESPEHVIVEWLDSGTGMRVVHRFTSSPRWLMRPEGCFRPGDVNRRPMRRLFWRARPVVDEAGEKRLLQALVWTFHWMVVRFFELHDAMERAQEQAGEGVTFEAVLWTQHMATWWADCDWRE